MSGMIGYNPEQVPTNGMLGKLAFQDSVIGIGGDVKVVNSIADLRALDSTQYHTVYCYFAHTAGDYGGGTFYFTAAVASVADDNGINIVANDGSGWTRVWDGVNALASWFGCTPASADCGPYFQYFPQYAYIWFGPGSYIFLTYPTELQFQNKFIRGTSTIFRCNGTFADATVASAAFTWSFVPKVSGTDLAGSNIVDMQQAGLSPIEGVGIIGNSKTTGVGFQIGSLGEQIYYIRPKNFSVGSFAIGFQFAPTIHNCFLTGLEQVTLKGNGTNLICDNTNYSNPSSPGAPNSGENFLFKSCYFGNGAIGASVIKAQLCTFDNCSFDYNTKQGFFNNSNTKLKNCYIEGNPSQSAVWFDVLSVACLDVDSSTNIYMLGGTSAQMNAYDVFNADPNGFGSPNVRCNASFFSSPIRYKPLCSSWSYPVTGKLMRCNSAPDVPPTSEATNLFPDVRFGRPDLSWWPLSTNCQLVATSTQQFSGATTGLAITPPDTATNAAFVFKVTVVPGENLSVQFLAMRSGTIQTIRYSVNYTSADGVALNSTTVLGGGPYNTTMTTVTTAWLPFRETCRVPMGATTATVSISVDPQALITDVGSLIIGTLYAYQGP